LFNKTYPEIFNVAKKPNSVTFAAFIPSLIKRNLLKIKYYINDKQAVAHLVEALRLKPYGRGVDWNFTLTYSFRPQYGPEASSASNRNE
jgi:hypothetical protein